MIDGQSPSPTIPTSLKTTSCFYLQRSMASSSRTSDGVSWPERDVSVLHESSLTLSSVCLCLDQITPVAWNKLAFERLVLPQKTKTLVQAMVMPRANKDADAEPEVRGDLIAGKGNGLIMLLHGPPGTGKTLTAESVAELAELPLYSVTCGDIGTSPEAVERYLNTVLHLGKTWNCGAPFLYFPGCDAATNDCAVLLLDEADVFLEQRSMADLDRNSLVSGTSHVVLQC